MLAARPLKPAPPRVADRVASLAERGAAERYKNLL
jgi:hypothetical protein